MEQTTKTGFPTPQKGDFKVYVLSCTYNQSAYIEDCIKGVAKQETNFPFVHHIVDDCSTDGEPDVIKAYLERECDMENVKYYDNDICSITVTKPKNNHNCTTIVYYLKKNLYKERLKKWELYAPWRKACIYEAICEGDDYWTNPHKLQKQVDVMDNDPSLAVCTHAYYKLIDNQIVKFQDCQDTDFRFNSSDSLKKWLTQPLSALIRLQLYPPVEVRTRYTIFRDNQCFYHLLKEGDGYNIGEYMGVYRITMQGVCTSMDKTSSMLDELMCYYELCENNSQDQNLRAKFLKLYSWYIMALLAKKQMPKLLPLRVVKLSGYAYCIKEMVTPLIHKFI